MNTTAPRSGTRSPRHGDWSVQGACVDEDPELFFPVGENERALAQIDRAREVCGNCVVRTACLAFALKANVQHGVWAGTVPEERARLKRRVEIVGRKGASVDTTVSTRVIVRRPVRV